MSDDADNFDDIFADCEDDDSPRIGEGLHCMDAEEGMSMLPASFADFIMLDGPYFISKEGTSNEMIFGSQKNNNFGEWDTGLTPESMLPLLKECRRVMKSGASIIVWTGWEALGEMKLVMMEAGLHVKRKITWIKKDFHPMMTGRGWAQAEENGLWATTSKRWDEHTFRHVGPSTSWFYGGAPKGGRRFHDCQKPTELYHYFMKELIVPGTKQVVVEPWAGSAPASVVALNLGCRYYGFEKDPGKVQIARERRNIMVG